MLNFEDFKKYIKQKEFLLIEGYGLLSMLQFFVRTAWHMMSFWVLFSYIKTTIYLSYQELGKNLISGSYSSEELTLISNNLFFSILFLFGFPIMLFVCIKNISNQDVRKLMKHNFYFFMLYTVAMMSSVMLDVTNLSRNFYLIFSILLLVYFILTRFKYLMRIRLLMAIGIVEMKPISLFWKNSLSYLIYQPDSLIFLNKKWLPYIKISMFNNGETILDGEWQEPSTTTSYRLKIESRLSGVSFEHRIIPNYRLYRKLIKPEHMEIGKNDWESVEYEHTILVAEGVNGKTKQQNFSER